MAIDRFSGLPGHQLTAPITRLEVADYTIQDYVFTEVPRCLICSSDGIIKVDAFGGGTGISLTVVKGYNPVRVTKIYYSGSDLMTVIGGA